MKQSKYTPLFILLITIVLPNCIFSQNHNDINTTTFTKVIKSNEPDALVESSLTPALNVDFISTPSYKRILSPPRKIIIKKTNDSVSKSPKNLTIEWIRNTTNVTIIDSKPEYGWVVPTKAISQLGYQILVSHSLQNLKNNMGDLWDSQQVRSSASSEIEYNGKPLKKGNTYYWKVRIWDQNNKRSPYSTSQSFTMGGSQKNITTANSFQIDDVKPVLFEKRNGYYFIDYGKAAFATINFNYKAKSPHTLTFRIGEQLEGKNINRTPFKKSHIRYQEIKVPVHPNQTKYQLPVKTNKRNTLPGKALPLPTNFPVLMPFRYAEVEGAQESITADDFIQLAHHSYWEDNASSFNSSNTILNQIWELCKYSIKATTFNGLYVDGDRERIPYEADAYLNQLCHYTTDREYAIARQTIEYFMEHPTWPTEWQQHVALMFHADYMYTGNTELIEKYYEPLKHKTLYELANEEGLITSAKVTPEFMYKLGFEKGYEKPLTDIVDWPSAGWGGDPNNKGERDGYIFKEYNTVINAFYYQNMKIMEEFAHILGKTEEAIEFKIRALKAQKALNNKMFDAEQGVYIDGIGTKHASLHANMLPLAFNMVPKEHIASVAAFIKSRKMACSVYGAQYLMDALYNAGEEKYALALLTDTSDRSWYNMIKAGSTITLEAWALAYKNNLDWNHAWGAVPANIIPRALWGIQPKTPGFKIATIKPQMGTLKNSSIKVPTLNGSIKAKYTYKSETLQVYEIEIPANMAAEFIIIPKPHKTHIHNGKKITSAFNTIRLAPGKHEIKLMNNTF